MAFQNKNLSVIAYANGFTLWHYSANDPVTQVTANNYFTPAKSMINSGDMMLVTGSDGNGTIRTVKILNQNIILSAI